MSLPVPPGCWSYSCVLYPQGLLALDQCSGALSTGWNTSFKGWAWSFSLPRGYSRHSGWGGEETAHRYRASASLSFISSPLKGASSSAASPPQPPVVPTVCISESGPDLLSEGGPGSVSSEWQEGTLPQQRSPQLSEGNSPSVGRTQSTHQINTPSPWPTGCSWQQTQLLGGQKKGWAEILATGACLSRLPGELNPVVD